MNQIGESGLNALTVSKVTQSINLDDTLVVQDAYIVVETPLLVIDDGIVTIGEGKTLLLDLYNILA